ncbi:MAG: S46 family peptidase, partial [Bacteroidota bacterium]
MKNILLWIALFLIIPCHVHAEEGMWIPMLLQKYNIRQMQEMGLRLSAEDIYSINHSSLKDAIVQFGGGCTGEIVSDEGLMLTNHHCGLGAIQRLSSMEHDYLT